MKNPASSVPRRRSLGSWFITLFLIVLVYFLSFGPVFVYFASHPGAKSPKWVHWTYAPFMMVYEASPPLKKSYDSYIQMLFKLRGESNPPSSVKP
jgi:hypothetical protein